MFSSKIFNFSYDAILRNPVTIFLFVDENFYKKKNLELSRFCVHQKTILTSYLNFNKSI